MNSKLICGKCCWDKWSDDRINELKNNAPLSSIGDKMVFESDRFKVWTIHLEPGLRLPFHIHNNPYFWTALSSGKSVSHYNDGRIVETEYKIGDTKDFPDLDKDNYFIHDLHNIGNETLIFTTVEFKL